MNVWSVYALNDRIDPLLIEYAESRNSQMYANRAMELYNKEFRKEYLSLNSVEKIEALFDKVFTPLDNIKAYSQKEFYLNQDFRTFIRKFGASVNESLWFSTDMSERYSKLLKSVFESDIDIFHQELSEFLKQKGYFEYFVLETLVNRDKNELLLSPLYLELPYSNSKKVLSIISVAANRAEFDIFPALLIGEVFNFHLKNLLKQEPNEFYSRILSYLDGWPNKHHIKNAIIEEQISALFSLKVFQTGEQVVPISFIRQVQYYKSARKVATFGGWPEAIDLMIENNEKFLCNTNFQN